ncbi:MAG: trans-sulfuration enzyme family protein [Woeseiaceae bacterium]
MRRETKLLHYGREPLPAPANPPVVRASTILHDTVESYEETIRRRNADDSVLSYGRRGTTTAHALMSAINDLEGGDGCWLFPSGVAAIATTLQAYLHQGDHLLVAETAFHATHTVCENFLKPNGVQVDTIPWNATDLSRWLKPETRVVFVESPGSETLEVMDLPRLCESAHDHGAIVIADNTYGSGWLYQPLELGCDVSIIAGTKYLSGHADVMMGAATARGGAVGELRQAVLSCGQTLAPDEAYATLRGMRTMNLRLERHEESALAVVRWLATRVEVDRVLHPALSDHPGHETWQRDASGTNGLVTVLLNEKVDIQVLLDSLNLVAIGSSWGGFESLAKKVQSTRFLTDAGIDERKNIVRFHIGLEHVADIIEDLDTAFEAALTV